MTLLQVAQSYVARGWSVVPVPRKSKAPIIKNWQSLRLKPTQLRVFTAGKNVGVLLGEPSGGLIDVDLDHPLAVELADVYLPPTAAEFGRASKPRSHRLYRTTKPTPTHKWTIGKTMIVELRSTGCQTVFPGSTHPSGEQIEWNKDDEPATVDRDELEAQLQALADEVRRRLGGDSQPHHTNGKVQAIGDAATANTLERAGRYLAKLPPAISGQGGHNAAFHAACMLVLGFGLDRKQALALLAEWNETCEPRWSRKELEHKVDDALKQPGERGYLLRSRPGKTPSARRGDAATATKPAGVERDPEPPEYVSFPTDLLPSPAREYVEAGSAALGCDPAYIALPLLSALASAVGNSRRVKLKQSWCEPCVLWTVIIGESGTLKSPALDLALEALRRQQAAAFRDYQNQLREYERQQQHYEADLTQWKKTGRKKSEPAPERPEPPIWQQSLAEDTTIEALAVLLENQPRGLLVARDELSGWLNSFDAYKSARGADVAHWLSMHRAGSMLVNRKSGRNIIRVPRASVSVCGGVQPLTLAAALAGRYAGDGPDRMDKPQAEHFANGLAARLLLSMPPRRPKQWTEADLSEAIKIPMDRRFDDLLALDATIDENGELVPVDVSLTAAAKILWVNFYNEHATEQCNLAGDLAAAWSKLEGYAPRLALLFQLIRDPASTAVDEVSMAAGIDLSRWFGEEAARIYGELGSTGDEPDARDRRDQQRLVVWIRKQGGAVTVRDLTRGPRRFRGDAEAAEGAFNQLAEAGYGAWEVGPAGAQGGRPSRIFRLATNGDGDETPSSSANGQVSSPVAGVAAADDEECEWSA